MNKTIPNVFSFLLSNKCIEESNILKTSDGFFMIYKSLSNILLEKNITYFFDSYNEKLACDRFFDDWFIYAVKNDNDYTYSLLKLREQEHDTKDSSPADGDTPGVTISFISLSCNVLINCLENSTDENVKKLNDEINRVVAYKGQRHHNALKRYFKNPQSQGAYLVADIYTKHLASYSENGCLTVPEYYKEIVQQSVSYKNSKKFIRIPRFIDTINNNAGHVICDNEKIYIENKENLTEHETLAILATHTGNTSFYSFAAEVEFHAKFLTPLAKIKIPFFGSSIYNSAIRADMTIQDKEFEGPAPFYNAESKIVKRQYLLHCNTQKKVNYLV